MKNMKGDERFWCDHCSINKSKIVDGKRVKQRLFFSCYTGEHFEDHLISKKHERNCEIGENKCKLCGECFDDEGWEKHKERNKDMWRFRKMLNEDQLTCNNFVARGKRFSSFQSLRDYIENDNTFSKSKTKDMDIIYPPMVNIEKEIQEIEEDRVFTEGDDRDDKNYEVPAQEEIVFDEWCSLCSYPVNYQRYNKDILKDRQIIVCDCCSDSEIDSD